MTWLYSVPGIYTNLDTVFLFSLCVSPPMIVQIIYIFVAKTHYL